MNTELFFVKVLVKIITIFYIKFIFSTQLWTGRYSRSLRFHKNTIFLKKMTSLSKILLCFNSKTCEIVQLFLDIVHILSVIFGHDGSSLCKNVCAHKFMTIYLKCQFDDTHCQNEYRLNSIPSTQRESWDFAYLYFCYFSFQLFFNLILKFTLEFRFQRQNIPLKHFLLTRKTSDSKSLI